MVLEIQNKKKLPGEDEIRVRFRKKRGRKGGTSGSASGVLLSKKGASKKGTGSFARGGRHRFYQRVTVKFRVGKTFGDIKSAKLRAHISYLSRDGAGDKGERGRFFGKEGELSPESVKTLSKLWEADRHHFRVILSPENAHELSLEEFTKKTLKEYEIKLGKDLQWFAINHFNTDSPHTHIVMRGKDSGGKDLVIKRDFISYGARELAAEVATRFLGLRTEKEIDRELQNSAKQLAPSIIDSWVERGLRDGIFKPHGYSAKNLKFIKLRLNFLEEAGLAKRTEYEKWELKKGFKYRLKALLEEEKLKRKIEQELGEYKGHEVVIFDIKNPPEEKITGKVIAKGLVDELSDMRYMLLAGVNGRSYYISYPLQAEVSGRAVPAGGVISVKTKEKKREKEQEKKYYLELHPEALTPIELTVKNEGITWLDYELMREGVDLNNTPFGATRFEAELYSAKLKRVKFLRSQKIEIKERKSGVFLAKKGLLALKSLSLKREEE